jgi:hypothetical protein
MRNRRMAASLRRSCARIVQARVPSKSRPSGSVIINPVP